MCHHRAVVFLLFLVFLLPALAFAGAGDISAETITVSVDARTGINVFGIVPGIPFVIGVPVSLSVDSVTIFPQFGFAYFFDVLTDLHSPFYMPIGLGVLYNEMSAGLDFMYYPAVGGTNKNHMMSVSVVSETVLYSRGKFSLLFEFKLGPMFILDPDGMRFFVSANSVFIPRYTL